MALAIPYTVFLGLYLLIAVVFVAFGLSSLYHLFRFGFLSTSAIIMSFVLMVGLVFIAALSYRMLSHIDWGQSLEFGQVVANFKAFNSIPN